MRVPRLFRTPAAARVRSVHHADGTEQQLRRRTPAGLSVPIDQPGLTWNDFVHPAPKPTGGARADRDHPSRRHDVDAHVTTTVVVEAPVFLKIGGAPANRAERRARRVRGPVRGPVQQPLLRRRERREVERDRLRGLA